MVSLAATVDATSQLSASQQAEAQPEMVPDRVIPNLNITGM